MYGVISLGTATFDVFLRSEGMNVEGSGIDKDLCFRLGAKLEVKEIYFDYGGGGTNSSVTFARQGLDAACVIQISDDFAGQKILADLTKEGVSTDLIDVQKNGYTDYSTILWAPDGGRTILVYRGKTRLEVKNVPWDKLEARWFYVSSLEGNLDIVEKLQGKIMWNPGGRELKQREKVLGLLSKITVLNVNKEEMEELLGLGSDTEDTGKLLQEAKNLPCPYVVITDDRRGAFLWSKNEGSWYHAGIFEDSPRVETTGAGDSFGSGLATGLIKGKSTEECLYLASANASSKVASVGAKKGLLHEADLVKWDRNKLKIEKLV